MAQLGLFGIFLGGTYTLEDTPQIPQLPDWANMLYNPARYLLANQRIMLVPGIAFLITISFNLLAEGLRRASLQTQQQVSTTEVTTDQSAA